MSNDFYPYLWYMEYKNIKKISFSEYIPYFELSLDGFNTGENAYINLNKLGIYFKNGIDDNLCSFYIRLLAKIRYIGIYSKLYLYSKDEDLCLYKWKYKKMYIKDRMYIFLGSIKDSFSSYVVYQSKNTFYIILDCAKTLKNEKRIQILINEFLPIGFNCVYLFDHFLFIDIPELSKLERWVAI